MKRLIVLASLCALFLSVQCEGENEEDSSLCELAGGDEEKFSTLADCFNDNFPQKLLELIDQCYERAYSEAGNTKDFVRKICSDDEDEQVHAMVRCLDEGEKVEGVEEEDIEKGFKDTKACALEKWN